MWHTKTIEETCLELDVDPSTGLSDGEASRRLEQYGRNILVGKPRKSLFRMILEQFHDTLIYVLLGAAVVSTLLGEISDSVIIVLVVVINAVVGVVQENRAEKALEALKKLSSPRAVVRRDGKSMEIDAWELVPGDVVVVDAGRVLPGDVRWIETVNLKVEEASLTGESAPVEKDANHRAVKIDDALGDRRSVGFMSTLATYGRGVGIVTATGMNTEIGTIAALLEQEETKPTPLQKSLDDFGKKLGIGILILCAGIFVFEVVRAYLTVGTVYQKSLLEFFLVAVSLAVAAIPEGLAAIVTIVLAIGVQKMIKENAIIRTLPSIETLGSVSFICSDKTGTMTQNRMTVTHFWTADYAGPSSEADVTRPGEQRLIEVMALCNDVTQDGQTKIGDATEVALVDLAMAASFNRAKVLADRPRIAEKPFDSDRKLMTTVHRDGEENLVYTKGAVENLLECCGTLWQKGSQVPLTPEAKAKILDEVQKMSGKALRVLGAAFKSEPGKAGLRSEGFESNLCFVGMVGMIDPPRLEVKDSIDACRLAGITTVMITGDHKETAFAIARDLGIAKTADQILAGPEIDALDDTALSVRAKTVRVFARVSPEHKVRIVKAFKANGAVVSMTGDGVNDAPSLKAADIGVAMGITGTDVAKGASDMILTDDNFKTIVRAVEQGRNIYNNIKKVIYFLLSCNTGEIIAIFGGIVLGLGSPLIPIHILWVNLVTDTLPALALCMDPDDRGIMRGPPRDSKESLFAGGGYRFILTYGVLVGAITLATFVMGLTVYGSTGKGLVHAETLAFGVLAISQLFHAFNLRHHRLSLFQVGLFTNWHMIGAFVICLGLQLSVMVFPGISVIFKVVPLSIVDWAIIFGLSGVPLVVFELEKWIRRIVALAKSTRAAE